MKRHLRYLCASFALLTSATQLPAQTPGDAIDPPDTEYQTGLEDIDPGIAARLPVNPAYRAFIPVSIDLSYRLPLPGNQGKAGSCTAWAVAYAARGYYTASLENRDIHLRKNVVSPNYVYNLARQLQNKPACKGGSSTDFVVEVLKKGALSLLEYPYHDSDCDAAPKPEVIATATDFRVRGFRLIDIKKIDDVKGALAQSQPVIIEFHVSPEWQHHRGGGVFKDTSFDASKDIWHAMTLVGYDERKQAFRLINSWGKGWGDHGYAWLSYEAFGARVRRAAVLDVAGPAPVIAEIKQQPPAPVISKPPVVDVPPPPKPVQVEPPPPKPAQVQPPPRPQVIVQIPKPPAPSIERPIPVVDEAPKKLPVDQPQPVVVNLPPTPKPVEVAPRIKPELSDLATLSCAKINVRTASDRNVLAGYVGSDSDLNLVKRVAAAVPNTSVGDVMLAPWPQCEAMQTLEKPLAAIDQPKIDIGPDIQRRAGDVLRIEVRSPPQISYLYVSYVQADGSVVHLVQPEGLVAQPTLPGRTLTFGDGKEGRAQFNISAPFGSEMIIAIASRSPLFDKQLPAHQTEREYLTALRQALIYKPSADMPDRELSASIKTLQTEAK
jgi:hypothetical protein